MSKFDEALITSACKELEYLQKAYCKENNQLTLDDLKQRHKEYLFEIIRMLRRCIETQMLGINESGVYTFSLCGQLLTLCLNYYDSLSTIESSDVLKEACKNFQETYNEAIHNIFDNVLAGAYYKLGTDFLNNERRILNSFWIALGEKTAPHLSVKGHHLNIFIPYPQEDLQYVDCYSLILQNLFPAQVRDYYSFYTRGLSSQLFTDTHLLHTTRDRVNIKSRSFDAVMVTYNQLFDDIRPRINAIINYVKKDGAVILVGRSTDFTKVNLRRIALVLQDIHVYFNPFTVISEPHDNGLCIIIGHIKSSETPSEFRKLLDIFTKHQAEETEFTLYGSGQDEYPVFASYDITEAEARILVPDIRNVTQKLLASISPKTVEDSRRPLLPFSSGQLGLVLISGDISGTVQEPDTKCFHVVKGSSMQRTDPKTEITATDDEGRPTRRKNTESVYTTTNVNVILPTGQFIELH